MDAAGQLRAADFKPRSLKKVLESELGEDWKKSPKKLLKAMTRVSDLYTVIFAARQRMIPEYIAKYEALHDKVRELSAQGLKALELTKDGLPSQDDLDAAQSNDVFELYAETRRITTTAVLPHGADCHDPLFTSALKAMIGLSPTKRWQTAELIRAYVGTLHEERHRTLVLDSLNKALAAAEA